MLLGNVIFNTISSLFGWLWNLILSFINNILYYIVEPCLAYGFAGLMNVLVWLLGVTAWIVNAALVGFVALFDGLAGLFIYGLSSLCTFLGFNAQAAMTNINSYLSSFKATMPTCSYVLYWIVGGSSSTVASGFLVTFNVLIFTLILKLMMRIVRG